MTVVPTPVRTAGSGSILKIALWWVGTGAPPAAAASSAALRAADQEIQAWNVRLRGEKRKVFRPHPIRGIGVVQHVVPHPVGPRLLDAAGKRLVVDCRRCRLIEYGHLGQLIIRHAAGARRVEREPLDRIEQDGPRLRALVANRQLQLRRIGNDIRL